VLTIDGRGENTSTQYGVAYRGGCYERLDEVPLPHSLCLLYEDVTRHLGFLHSSDEYKVMALASYGTSRFVDTMRQHVRWLDAGRYVVDAPPLATFCTPRRPGDPFLPVHADVAHAAQRVLEETVLKMTRWLRERTGLRHLAMAGGVALNCVMNGVLREAGVFDDIWVQPAAGDAGTAPGAALWIDRVALGARSILVSPLSPSMQARLNELKDREDFRPVAPAVLEDAAGDWFEGCTRSPFMLFVHRVPPDRLARIPAACHADGTARVQTVARATNPPYHDLIAAFAERTGVPVVINTSFNTRGKPIVLEKGAS
jgi:predicted NodU family carbamoyl transferase